MIRSQVKDSKELRSAFEKRWTELKLNQKEVAEDAFKLTGDKRYTRRAVNRYLRSPYDLGALNEEQIIFLAKRWAIDITFEIVVKDYNAKDVLEKLKESYPQYKEKIEQVKAVKNPRAKRKKDLKKVIKQMRKP